jgi:hypothetical protein
MLSGQSLGLLPVGNLRGKNIAQHPLPARHQEFGAAEPAVDDLGFFQEIDRSAALGSADENVGFRFGRNFHFRLGRR